MSETECKQIEGIREEEAEVDRAEEENSPERVNDSGEETAPKGTLPDIFCCWSLNLNWESKQVGSKGEDGHEEEDEEEVKKQRKAGVIYLSRIPTKMNVRIIREYFTRYGDVDRIFLEPRG